MKIDWLYKPTPSDIPKAVATLVECFKEDPLYKRLIPQEDMRRRILPDVFDCDAHEMFNYCDMFADSPDVNSLVILEDPSEHRSGLRKRIAERFYLKMTEDKLIEDGAGDDVLANFRLAKDYLSDEWTKRAGGGIHIIYLAVRAAFHGKGLAHRLITPVLDCADDSGLAVTLETHNPDNLTMYRHYGFELFEIFSAGLDLKQYCLVRKPREGVR